MDEQNNEDLEFTLNLHDRVSETQVYDPNDNDQQNFVSFVNYFPFYPNSSFIIVQGAGGKIWS